MKENGNITISLDEIKAAFQDLILEKKTREEITDWAIQLSKANDEDKLSYLPKNEKWRIWEALEFLAMADAADVTISPTAYLFSQSQFEDYIKEHLS